jgi:hypothetical protein
MISVVRKSQKLSRRPRAPRVRVPNRERALFTVDGSNFVGVLQRLSITGGSALLSRGPIPHGTMGDIVFKTAFGKVTAHVEFLQSGADGVPLAQAFHFLAMEDASSERLAAASRKMQQEGRSDVPPTKRFASPASGVLNQLFSSIRNLASALMPERASSKR